MKRAFRAAACAALLSLPLTALPAPPMAAAKAASPAYGNFRVAIYIAVTSTRQLADKATFDREFERAMRQTHFNKVYLEVYRNHVFATDEEVIRVKKWFEEKGVQVSGGITLAAGGEGGQFGTFDYEKPADREECAKAAALAAKHFDDVILDDFFFYASKSDADIAAKGNRSWTQYRLETMRQVARDLVLKPAKAANPKVRMIVKYPNWYEHFQGAGYDLEQESQDFDAIYTGTETRDPVITDQLLQQYESYEIYRYYSNIRPTDAAGGVGNGGGWVDTYSTLYVDRYAEQLWDTLFAKAPEITLFNWRPMSEAEAVKPGDRQAWAGLPTSFRWQEMVSGYKAGPEAPGSQAKDPGPGWGRVAGYALETVDKDLGKLGKPIGIASYKPYQSSGEDFLHNYLGTIGIPIELSPKFPTNADVALLTQAAAQDPRIVDEIKGNLVAGKTVVITSGLLSALKGKGIEDIAEVWDTGRKVAIHDFINGYGAGNGDSLNDPAHDNPAVLFPEVHYYTNDSWPIIRGVANAKGFPILLMNRYSKGVLYVLTMPDNPGDLYNLPQGLVTEIKKYLQQDFPVRLDSPDHVSLFAYDNGTFVVESFRDQPVSVTLSLLGQGVHLRNLSTNADIAATPAAAPKDGKFRRDNVAARTDFGVTVQPHSYQVFKIEK
ncbi:hypothetical protein FBZ89_1534 [Nitrospirillum amazonense]|uniref:Uncharacterized protein n=1 Tax=Nitrospirillum amazonense TaxID=28077 RepID=A0A560EHQ2_9PROT|nr:hypothetical protein [Nitrospirillum amazonense]TWB08785.1 hypothetical protein FBZ89_1534 [Nitrospirillum amazonense]